MPRMYTLASDIDGFVTPATDLDLVQISTASERPIELVGFSYADQLGLGVATENWMRLQIIRGYNTPGGAGASLTPRPVSPVDTAASTTASEIPGTLASDGSPVVMESLALNNRNGLQAFYPLSCGIVHLGNVNEILVLRVKGNGSVNRAYSWTLWFLEYP